MDNLRPEFHDAFIQYMVTVVKHFRDHFGLNFRTVDPFNESTSTWWQRGGAQEGCHFGTRKQSPACLRCSSHPLGWVAILTGPF